MLGLNKQSLLFPRLVYLRDEELVREPFLASDSNPPIPNAKPGKMVRPLKQRTRIYKLSWEDITAKKQERAHDNYERMPNPEMTPFTHPPCIPRSYAARMDVLEFSIQDTYMKAINHCCRQAMMEWEHPYPFDTCIREHCYIASKAFVESAIHLLADCIYDPETRYFNRDFETKVVFEQTALLRFWRYQMGMWAAFEAAGLKILLPGSEPAIKNTMYELPGPHRADSRLVMMHTDMLDFHNSLLSHQRLGPFIIEGKKCTLKGDPWNTVAANQGKKRKLSK